MHPRVKALDGLLSELGNMEYEDYETRRRRQPASLSEGEAEAPTSEKTATSLPTGGNQPASRPPEYKSNVDDVAEQTYAGGGNRERFDTPPAAKGVPSDMMPKDTNSEQGAGRLPAVAMGNEKYDTPPVTAAHETQHGKMPIETSEPAPVIKRARKRSMMF